ncbi:hydrogenase 1, small subunit [Escherichia coli]|nr:hydrogenase 1, small subunit [Escherichia coli]
MNNEETFYQAMRRQGVTRRSFLKYCSLAATSLGLGAGMAPKIAWALENKPRIPVVWIHGLECTCCTESFIRSAHPLAKDVILSLISLDYDDTLMAAAGTQAEEVFEDIITQYNGKYILAVEGNPPLGEQGMFCISSGRPFIEKTQTCRCRSQCDYRLGNLRVLGLRAGRATQSDAGNAYRQSHHRQTHYQSTWLPADPGCDERHHYLHGDL